MRTDTAQHALTPDGAPGPSEPAGSRREALPLAALLALATAVFVTSLTETLPAGLLPGMSGDLAVGESAMGQSVTIYAVGTALTAVPLTAFTAGWRRKRLLLAAMAGFAAANTVTAVSTDYTLTMTARFVAGVAAGLAWALLAGYARRLVPAHLGGRAIAIAMAGIPVALSLGVPAGTFLGNALGWRTAFWAMTALTAVLLGWITARRPRPARAAAGRPHSHGRRAAHPRGAARPAHPRSAGYSPIRCSTPTSPPSSTTRAWAVRSTACCWCSAPPRCSASGPSARTSAAGCAR